MILEIRPRFLPRVIFKENITHHILDGNMCGPILLIKLIIILFTMCSVFSIMYTYFTYIILLLIFIKI